MGKVNPGFVLLNLLQQELGLIQAREALSASQQLFKLSASLNVIARFCARRREVITDVCCFGRKRDRFF